MEKDIQTILSSYEDVSAINEKHGVTLVQHITSKAFYVKKKLSVYDASVYEYLMKNPMDGIPKIFEAIESDNNLYVIEEYISGTNLDEILSNGNLFDEKQTVEIIIKLLNIVKRLHSATPAIIHRDIKPSNIILKDDGTLYLLDMNAAKKYSPNKSADTELIGTVGYAAPEQYGFAPSSASSDFYSIGVLANVLLTGKFPNEKISNGRLGRVISKATSMDPVDRYTSADEMISDICSSVSRRFLPPGYRTGNPAHMFIASLGYALLLLLTFALRNEDSKLPILSNIAFFVSILSAVLFSCNYLGIQDKVIVSRIKNKALKTALIIFIDFFIIFICILIICVIPESLVE